MSDIIRARRRFKFKLTSKQDTSTPIAALLGRGNGVVAVPNQAGQVYIRIGNQENYGTAYNDRVPLIDDLPVFVGYDPVTDPDRRLFQVLTIRQSAYVDAGSPPIPSVGAHHTTHEFGGGDDVYLTWRRLMGLRVGRPALFVVTVDSGYLYRGTTWIAAPVGATTADLTAQHAALVGNQAQYVLISLSPTGAISVLPAGTIKALPALLLPSDIPTPPAGNIPLAAVRIYKTQTAIGDLPAAPDIIDLRFPTYATMGTHEILSVTHSDTTPAAIVRGDILTGQGVAPLLTRLALGGIVGSVVTRNATDVSWSTFALAGTAAQTYTFPAAGGTVALLNAANSFTLINPLTTIAESWIGPSATTGIYFRGGFVGIGTVSPAPLYLFHVRAADGISDNSYAAYISNEEATANRNNGLWINAGSSASDYNVRAAAFGGAALWSVTGAGLLTAINLALSATSNQIVLQSAGVTGTLTWTPAASNKIITLPNITGTVALLEAANTFTAVQAISALAAPQHDIYSTSVTTPATITTYAVNIRQSSGTAPIALGSDANFAYIQSFGNKPLQVNNQGNDVIFCATAGKVGIGNLSPNHPLTIQSSNTGLELHRPGDAAATQRFRMFVGNGTTYSDAEIYIQALNVTMHFQSGAAGTTETLTISDVGAVKVAGAFGCNGAAAQAQLSVTGIRENNTALASLLTQLAKFGFITDNTTAT